MKKRILTAAALFAMLLNVSCGSAQTPDQDTSLPVSSEPAAETEEVTQALQSGVPKDKTFAGTEINILNAANTYNGQTELFHVEETNGDIMNDTVYKRNNAVMEKLDVRFNFIDNKAEWVLENLNQIVLAGDDAYDLVTSKQAFLNKFVLNGIFTDLIDAPYIDITKPWWPEDYIQKLNIGNLHRYYLTGDITIGFLRWITACYYNKNMYQSYFDDADELYDIVLDGKWTLDKLAELTKNVFVDVNNNGEADPEDILGYTTQNYAVADGVFYNAGGTVLEYNGDGMPELNVVTDRNNKLMEKMYYMFFENPGTCMLGTSWDSLNKEVTAKLAADEMLFMFGWLHSSENLRDMKSDYGIIPYPKMDEQQESYRALIHDEVPTFVIPLTCQKPDTVCAVIEDLAYFGYQEIAPAYYELVLKGKYMRDGSGKAMQVIDIIHDSSYTETALAYADNLAQAGFIHRELMMAQSKNLASGYEKIRSKAEAAMEQLIGQYYE